MCGLVALLGLLKYFQQQQLSGDSWVAGTGGKGAFLCGHLESHVRSLACQDVNTEIIRQLAPNFKTKHTLFKEESVDSS